MKPSLYVVGNITFTTLGPLPSDTQVHSIGPNEAHQLHEIYKKHPRINKAIIRIIKNDLPLNAHIVDITIKIMKIMNVTTFSVYDANFYWYLERISIITVKRKPKSVLGTDQKFKFVLTYTPSNGEN
jgi:hypothetical protein